MQTIRDSHSRDSCMHSTQDWRALPSVFEWLCMDYTNAKSDSSLPGPIGGLGRSELWLAIDRASHSALLRLSPLCQRAPLAPAHCSLCRGCKTPLRPLENNKYIVFSLKLTKNNIISVSNWQFIAKWIFRQFQTKKTAQFQTGIIPYIHSIFSVFCTALQRMHSVLWSIVAIAILCVQTLNLCNGLTLNARAIHCWLSSPLLWVYWAKMGWAGEVTPLKWVLIERGIHSCFSDDFPMNSDLYCPVCTAHLRSMCESKGWRHIYACDELLRFCVRNLSKTEAWQLLRLRVCWGEVSVHCLRVPIILAINCQCLWVYNVAIECVYVLLHRRMCHNPPILTLRQIGDDIDFGSVLTKPAWICPFHDCHRHYRHACCEEWALTNKLRPLITRGCHDE